MEQILELLRPIFSFQVPRLMASKYLLTICSHRSKNNLVIRLPALVLRWIETSRGGTVTQIEKDLITFTKFGFTVRKKQNRYIATDHFTKIVHGSDGTRSAKRKKHNFFRKNDKTRICLGLMIHQEFHIAKCRLPGWLANRFWLWFYFPLRSVIHLNWKWCLEKQWN